MPAEIFVALGSDYTDEATIFPSQVIKLVQFAIAAPNSATYEVAVLDYSGKPRWSGQEQVAQPGVGGFVDIYGIRFKNFDPALPTTVLCDAYFTDDVTPTGFQGSSVATSFSTSGASTGIPVSVVVGSNVGTPTPIIIADPGVGVSDITLYDVSAGYLARFDLVTYLVTWDTTGGLGDRAVLYELIYSGNHFAWGQPGNTIYTESATPNRWLETDVGSMGNYLSTIASTIPVDPLDSNLDFEQASAPFGTAFFPEGFSLHLILPQFAASDEVTDIQLLVTLVPAP